MKINAITNYCYNNNNSKSCQNKPNFGYIKLRPEYISELRRNCGNEAADKVIELCNKHINLKKLIDYDTLPKARKALADEFFKVMSPEEVEDFTIDFTAISKEAPHYFSYDGESTLSREVTVQLFSELPKANMNGDALELAVWKPFEFNSANLRSSLYGKSTPSYLEWERNTMDKRLKENIGFAIAGNWFPIPTEALYGVIARCINRKLDTLKYLIDKGYYKANQSLSTALSADNC